MIRLLISSFLAAMLICLLAYADGVVLSNSARLMVWVIITIAYYINNKAENGDKK